MIARGLLVLCLVGLPLLSNRQAYAVEPQFLGRTRQQWIADLEAGGGRRRRTHAAWALSQMANQNLAQTDAEAMRWLNELFLLCEDESSAIRYWGVMGLQRFVTRLRPEHPAHSPTLKLLNDLATNSSPSVQLSAAETLILVGQTEQPLAVLTKGLASPHESVRIQAIAALERIGPAARPAKEAIREATIDPSEYVKRISARALAKLESSE